MMKILHVCAEFFPLLKTGGLADVTGALPLAQNRAGMDSRLLLPAFPALRQGVKHLRQVAQCDTFAGFITLLYGEFNGINMYLIDAPHLYDRPGSPYHDGAMNSYPDNLWRFALLGFIASEIACGMDSWWKPQIIHAHDWHAGLTPAYLAARHYPAQCVFTIHNLAYQGLFNARHMADIQLPGEFYNLYGLEFNGELSFLKAGLYYASHITSVSPRYAQEITRPPSGYGMEGLLRQRQQEGRLSGILNGVDDSIWNPATDPQIAARYRADTLARKQQNKRQLQQEMGLTVSSHALLFVVVSRLTAQKGLDLLLQALPALLQQGGQLALLGSGDEQLQEAFLSLAADYPGQLCVTIGYDEALSHRFIAGGDVIVIPSRFEPCGLTQLYGLKYGTLPLVRRTGGLADTVSDCSLENLADDLATGLVFEDSNSPSLLTAIRRAFVLWSRPELWQQVQRQAMHMNFSWQAAAQSYQKLYQHLT